MSPVIGSVGGVRRGCGLRVEGGLYAECGLSPSGKPVEHFLACPPARLNLERLGITPLGVQIRQFPGVWHVIDWVGSEHYPYVSDFVEEVRRYGMSRRLAKNADVSKLTHESKFLLLHSRAIIRDLARMKAHRIGGHALGYEWDTCPKGKVHEPGEMCAGLWWEDVLQLQEHEGEPLKMPERIGRRLMPSYWYKAARPPGLKKTHHDPAVFAIFPISRLVVVRAKDGSHEETLDRVKNMTSLPVEAVDN